MGRGLSKLSIFDVFAWVYNIISANGIWQTSSAGLLDHVPSTEAPLQVLDLGVGPGVSALAMGRQHPNHSYIGLDIAQPMLSEARDNRRRAGWLPQRLSLLHGDALQLPLANETVHVVTGHSFFYLLPDRPAALAEIHRVLKP